MRKLFFILLLITFSNLVFAQTDTLSGDAAKALMKQVLDSSSFVQTYGRNACSCVEKIKIAKKGSAEISALIGKCIDKEVESYQLTSKLMGSMTGGSNNIVISTDKTSLDYQKYYQELENWMIDSCAVLRNYTAANNKQSKNSVSDNKKAQAFYELGVSYDARENYPKAIDSYLKALELDDKFAFAWDNLGVAYRKNNEFDNAIKAYKKSLEIDPNGITPLHNIPVVYEYQKKYSEALEAYLTLEKIDSKDPESYYGAGRMYIFLEKYESALRQMCTAYNLYAEMKSPYRSDAEKNIQFLYQKMKEDGKEELVKKILKEYKLIPTE